MKTSIETLQPILRSLRMGGMAESLPMRIMLARKGETDHLQFLSELVEDEMNRRAGRLQKRRLSAAKIPSMKTLEDFDWTFNPRVPRRLIQELSSGQFVHEKRDVLFVGPPGVGKTHLCCALAQSAVAAGWKTLWKNAFDLADDLVRTDRPTCCTTAFDPGRIRNEVAAGHRYGRYSGSHPQAPRNDIHRGGHQPACRGLGSLPG
jgi:DNA replication protein DnaC